jgi:hypothetical protein
LQELNGTRCKMRVSCPAGWQLDDVKKQNGQDPCEPCKGIQQLYSLGNTCHECPQGFDCSEGYFRLRPKRDAGFWMGQPYFMTCVSNGTLTRLRTIGVDVVAAQSDAARHAEEQANMGVSRVIWRCGENSTMVSSAADVLRESLERFHGSALVYACRNPEACIVQADGSADCAEGYWGPLCGLCLEGYAWSEGHICTRCDGDTLPLRMATVVGAAVAFFLAMYNFLAHPLFDRDGVSLGHRAIACARRCAHRRSDSQQPVLESSGSRGGPTAEPSQTAEPKPGRSAAAPNETSETSPVPAPEPTPERATALSQTEPSEGAGITRPARVLRMLQRVFKALRALVETVKMTYEALAEYWENNVEALEYRDEKQGAQARCLIGFSQVDLSSCTVPRRLLRTFVSSYALLLCPVYLAPRASAGHFQHRGHPHRVATRLPLPLPGAQEHQALF